MSFQWIVDSAETLSINARKMVAISTARDGTTRAVSRGTPPARIEIKVADGMPWDLIKDDIAAAEVLDRITTATITIPYAGYEWYYGNVDPITPDSYTVRCVEFPNWTIFARNQVSWDGPFVFQAV